MSLSKVIFFWRNVLTFTYAKIGNEMKYFQIQIVAKSLNDVFVLVHVRCKRTFIDTKFLSYTKI